MITIGVDEPSAIEARVYKFLWKLDHPANKALVFPSMVISKKSPRTPMTTFKIIANDEGNDAK